MHGSFPIIQGMCLSWNNSNRQIQVYVSAATDWTGAWALIDGVLKISK